MQKSGFTLVELIITIGLLALLATLIASNMVGLQSRQLAANYESYKEQIEEAGCIFLESKYVSSVGVCKDKDCKNIVMAKSSCVGSICFVKTGVLLDYGYLDIDMENPLTGFPVTRDEIVQITYVDGVKTCTYMS